MSNVTQLTLDGVTFNNEGVDNNKVVYFVDRSSEFIAGFRTVTARVHGPNGNGNIHSTWKITSPVVSTAADAQGNAGRNIGQSLIEVHASMTPSLTAADRQDAYDRLLSLVQTDAFKESITLLKPAL